MNAIEMVEMELCSLNLKYHLILKLNDNSTINTLIACLKYLYFIFFRKLEFSKLNKNTSICSVRKQLERLIEQLKEELEKYPQNSIKTVKSM